MLATNMSVHTWWDKMTAKTSTLYLQWQLVVYDKEDKNGSSSQWYFLLLVFKYHNINDKEK